MTKQLNRDFDVLGMEFSKANQRLIRMLIFKYVKKNRLDTCYRCKNKIEKFEELSIDHIENWTKTKKRELKPELFLKWDNIAFSHHKCNCAASNAYTGSSKYVGVRWFFDKRKGYGKWCSYIGKDIGGRFQYFGYHDDEKLAAHARDLGVMKFYNGNALMNFPEHKELYKEIIANGWGEYPFNSSRKDCKTHYSYFKE